jgi:hypothetical protein
MRRDPGAELGRQGGDDLDLRRGHDGSEAQLRGRAWQARQEQRSGLVRGHPGKPRPIALDQADPAGRLPHQSAAVVFGACTEPSTGWTGGLGLEHTKWNARTAFQLFNIIISNRTATSKPSLDRRLAESIRPRIVRDLSRITPDFLGCQGVPRTIRQEARPRGAHDRCRGGRTAGRTTIVGSGSPSWRHTRSSLGMDVVPPGGRDAPSYEALEEAVVMTGSPGFAEDLAVGGQRLADIPAGRPPWRRHSAVTAPPRLLQEPRQPR